MQRLIRASARAAPPSVPVAAAVMWRGRAGLPYMPDAVRGGGRGGAVREAAVAMARRITLY